MLHHLPEDASPDDLQASATPPQPKTGDWTLFNNEHWFLGYPNKSWRTLSRDEIFAITSDDQLPATGRINSVQRELFEGVVAVPYENQSPSQRRVYNFVTERLSGTNHPLAPWAELAPGIRRDFHGTYSPYDLIGYLFLYELVRLHSTEPRQYGHEYLLWMVPLILFDRGRYARAVSTFYPAVSRLSPNEDPLDVTFIDSAHLFNPTPGTRLTPRLVIQYLWEVLRIPRYAVEFNLEPYIQTSSAVRSIVVEWQGWLDDLAAGGNLPESYGVLRRLSGAELSQLFLQREETAFQCGRFPLRRDDTGAVGWAIPPAELRDTVTRLRLGSPWMRDSDRDFASQWSDRRIALGVFASF